MTVTEGINIKFNLLRFVIPTERFKSFILTFLYNPTLPTSQSAASTEFAEPLPSVPSSVLQNSAAAQTIFDNPSLFKIITPINVNCFEALLVTHPNQPLVSSVCQSLREGVWPFACPDDSAPTTFDFSGHPTCDAGLSFLREQWDIELDCEQYSPSFGSELLPGMYSTPIGVVPKPHSNKFCLVKLMDLPL